MMAGRMDEAGEFTADKLDVNEVRHYAKLDHPDGTRPLIFLNACQIGKTGRTLNGTGGMAEAFIRRGAGLFVGTLWSIGDRTALGFSSEFYERLKAGANVTEAVRAAREKAKAANEPTWLAYTVYGHPYARLRASA
jgi:CHAT domain-containing protein